MRALKVAGQLGALALVLALLGLLGWKIAATEGAAKVGEPAPRFELPRLDDDARTIALTQYRGKVVVVNFWASWCGPCRDEAPVLQRAATANARRGVVVIGVNQRDFVEDARAFVREYGITYPNAYDGPGKLFERYGMTGWPETFVVSRDGTIVEHVAGPIEDAEQLDAAIAKAVS